MEHAQSMALTHPIPWFKSWFDSTYYHKLYAYRDEKEAADFVDRLIDLLRPSMGSAMLDVGCGTGRHSRRLASKGFHVVGLDLASGSIRKAKQFESERLRFVQHDMRQPFGKHRFDYVFSFFTSFGYFMHQSENQHVVRNMSSALKDSGTLIFDYLNVAHAQNHTVPFEEKEVDGIVYTINRWMNETHFFKRIAIDGAQIAEPVEYTEQVRKFSLQDFERLFAPHHLRIESVFGSYALDGYEWETSPRMIIVAKKSVDS